MSLAKIRHLSTILSRRYGVVGRVASKYVEAGFRVSFLSSERRDIADFIAYKGRNRFVVKVVYSSRLSEDTIKKLAAGAKRYSAKPVLALYGRVKPLSDAIRRIAEENGVVLKRVR